jgi:menaquinone-specific isochorismate synthase
LVPPLHAYGWIAGERGFAGATPELLISLRGGVLETMALAGTARAEDREVFKVDEKEIREHEYVTQALIAKLSDAGVVRRGSRDVLNLGAIVHFVTRIQVELTRERSADEWLALLHPTPALGPHPRTVDSLEMLREWRERLEAPEEFGAPFGVVDDGRFDAVVAIRGLWWQGARVFLPSGCGVIEASRLVNEWRELRLKREAVKRFFGQG